MANLINLGSELLRICPTNAKKIEVSINNGKTWSTHCTSISYGDFYDLTIFGTELLATTSKGVYVSINQAKSWTSRCINPNYGSFQSIQVNGNELLATTSKGLYVSKNKGASWTKRSQKMFNF